MNVKVNKERLIAAITSKRAELLKAQANEDTAEAKDFEARRKEVITQAEAFIKRVNALKFGAASPQYITGYGTFYIRNQRNQAGPSVADYTKMLATLALVDEEYITLTEKRDNDLLRLL